MKTFLIACILLASASAKAAETTVQAWAAPATAKIATSQPADLHANVARVAAAKREVAAFHVVLRSNVDIANVSAKVTLANIPPDHVTIWREHYVNTNLGPKPDPLSPLDKPSPLALKKDESQPLLVEIDVPADANAGDDRGTVDILTGDKIVASLPIELHVYNFALPITPSLRTAFGNEVAPIIAFEGVAADSPELARMRKAYYEILLAHRISPYNIPVDLNSPDSDVYLNDPRMTSYTIPYPDKDDALKSMVDRLRKVGAFSKGYFYVVDEPSTEDAFKRLDAAATRLKRVVGPDYKMISPYCANPQFKTDKDIYDLISDRVTIWCYLTSMQWYHPDKLDARRKAGEEIWNYVAWVPLEPACNFQVQQPAMHNRMLFWQEWKYSVSGLLYWSTNWWSNNAGGTVDPWKDMATVKWASKDVFGDGSLLYPGKPIGADGPMPSLRLKLIRQGMQDYEYITLAAKRAGKEKVDAIVNSQVKNWTEYQQDPLDLEKAKARFAELIDQ